MPSGQKTGIWQTPACVCLKCCVIQYYIRRVDTNVYSRMVYAGERRPLGYLQAPGDTFPTTKQKVSNEIKRIIRKRPCQLLQDRVYQGDREGRPYNTTKWLATLAVALVNFSPKSYNLH